MFVITVINAGVKFWLRSTVWTNEPTRASLFLTREGAVEQRDKARKFGKASIFNKSTIEEVAPL